jgi:hypothetical protein
VQSLAAAKQAWNLADRYSIEDIAQVTVTDAPVQSLPNPIAKPLKSGAVSVFFSRKEGKLFVRKGYEPVFDMPITIAQPELPLGTHVITAIASDGDAYHWNAVTVNAKPGLTATAALNRITIPDEARERIEAMMSAGSSITITDHGLGGETGKGTDFNVTNP